MHRSGTSCLAGSLQQRGLFLGKVFENNPYNIKGNREHEMIRRLNEEVLFANGGTWDNPPERIITWKKRHSIRRDILITRFSLQSQLWGFKDPRTILTLPFWKEGLPNFSIVGTFRHPIVVANSLEHRNNMPFEKGLRLWKEYNMKLLDIFNKQEFPLISFDEGEMEYLKAIDSIIDTLGFKSKKIGTTPFYDIDLKHYTIKDQEYDIPEDILAIYTMLKKNACTK